MVVCLAAVAGSGGVGLGDRRTALRVRRRTRDGVVAAWPRGRRPAGATRGPSPRACRSDAAGEARNKYPLIFG